VAAKAHAGQEVGELHLGGMGGGGGLCEIARAFVSLVRYAVCPWIATVTQGYTASIEGEIDSIEGKAVSLPALSCLRAWDMSARRSLEPP
jgi:hypothetical protein